MFCFYSVGQVKFDPPLTTETKPHHEPVSTTFLSPFAFESLCNRSQFREIKQSQHTLYSKIIIRGNTRKPPSDHFWIISPICRHFQLRNAFLTYVSVLWQTSVFSCNTFDCYAFETSVSHFHHCDNWKVRCSFQWHLINKTSFKRWEKMQRWLIFVSLEHSGFLML